MLQRGEVRDQRMCIFIASGRVVLKEPLDDARDGRAIDGWWVGRRRIVSNGAANCVRVIRAPGRWPSSQHLEQDRAEAPLIRPRI